jgi:hypothetical protein
MFCDNEKCRLNKVTDASRPFVLVRDYDGEKVIRNHEYYANGKHFFLCDNCHDAVEFTRDKMRPQ